MLARREFRKMHTSSTVTETAQATIKRSQKPLPQNPFTTHRDPETGQWVVVMNEGLNKS